MALEFDYISRQINVTPPQTTVDVGTLLEEIRVAEASEDGVVFPQIAFASGRQSLGDGVTVGLTVLLMNSWQLKFWAGNYIAKISGGNLVGGISGDPVAYTNGVQVLLIQSAASTIVNVGGSALTSEQAQKLEDIHKANWNKRSRDSGTGVITIFDDNKTNVYKQFNSNSDLSEIDPI